MPFARTEAADPVSEPGIRHLLEAMEWDWPGPHRGPVGLDSAGEVIVPLSTYLTFASPAYRERGGSIPNRMMPPYPYRHALADSARMMATAVEVDAGEAMRVGDHLVGEWVVAGSSEAQTRLGPGRFVTIEAKFRAEERVVATERTTLLGFSGDVPAVTAQPAATAQPLQWAQSTPNFDPSRVRVGAVLAPIRCDMTLQRLTMIHAANRDFAPIHHDLDAAAEIGAPAPVINSMYVLALTEQLLIANGGPGSRVSRLGPARLRKPTPAGAEIIAAGRVVAVQDRMAEIEVEIGTVDAGLSVTSAGTLLLPA